MVPGTVRGNHIRVRRACNLQFVVYRMMALHFRALSCWARECGEGNLKHSVMLALMLETKFRRQASGSPPFYRKCYTERVVLVLLACALPFVQCGRFLLLYCCSLKLSRQNTTHFISIAYYFAHEKSWCDDHETD